jgi:hypothetical protein
MIKLQSLVMTGKISCNELDEIFFLSTTEKSRN